MDLGEDSVEQDYLSSNVMARGKVLFHGHPVAAVSATDASIAQDALELIEVKYQVLPPVLDVEAAMEKDAPILWEDLRTDEFGEMGKEPSNVAQTLCT